MIGKCHISIQSKLSAFYIFAKQRLLIFWTEDQRQDGSGQLDNRHPPDQKEEHGYLGYAVKYIHMHQNTTVCQIALPIEDRKEECRQIDTLQYNFKTIYAIFCGKQKGALDLTQSGMTYDYKNIIFKVSYYNSQLSLIYLL